MKKRQFQNEIQNFVKWRISNFDHFYKKIIFLLPPLIEFEPVVNLRIVGSVQVSISLSFFSSLSGFPEPKKFIISNQKSSEYQKGVEWVFELMKTIQLNILKRFADKILLRPYCRNSDKKANRKREVKDVREKISIEPLIIFCFFFTLFYHYYYCYYFFK